MLLVYWVVKWGFIRETWTAQRFSSEQTKVFVFHFDDVWARSGNCQEIFQDSELLKKHWDKSEKHWNKLRKSWKTKKTEKHWEHFEKKWENRSISVKTFACGVMQIFTTSEGIFQEFCKFLWKIEKTLRKLRENLRKLREKRKFYREKDVACGVMKQVHFWKQVLLHNWSLKKLSTSPLFPTGSKPSNLAF